MTHHVYPAAHSGANELCHRSGGCTHFEWPVLEALPVLGQIGDQTAVLLHSFDHGLPRLAAEFPAVKEDNGGGADRTGFPRKQNHVSDPSTVRRRTAFDPHARP